MVITGGNNNGHITPSSQILDLNENHWSLGPELPHGLWGHCSVLLPNGDLVVLGGWPDKSSGVSKYAIPNQPALRTVFLYLKGSS